METFDKIIDFTRTTSGSYVDSDGKIKVTPASRNLLTYTQEFDNGAWSKSGANAYPFDPALATYGPELVTNGDFSAGSTGWITGAGWSITGGQLVGTTVTGGAPTTHTVNTGAGRWFAVTFTVVSVSAGQVSIGMGASLGTARSSPGTYTEYFIGTAATNGVAVYQRVSDFTGTIDNISVREVTGGLITAPDGTLTADAVLPTATTAAHNVQQAGGGSGTPLTLSVYAKAGSHSFMQLSHGSGSAIYANFNLLTGAVGTVGVNATASITPAGDGWYRCAMTFTPGASANLAIGHITSATAGYRESWAATGTESIYLWGAQFEFVPDANLVLGSELVTNGDFSSGSTGWAVSGNDATHVVTFSGGAMRYQSDTISPPLVVQQAAVLVVGRLYRIETATSAWVSGSLKTDSLSALVVSSGPGTTVVYGYATATTLKFTRNTAAVDLTIDRISVKEITSITGMSTEYTRNNGGLYPPRFDYDPVTLAPRGLLIEQQQTNLLLRSEEFENAAWTKSNVTVTANAGVSPDGTADADLLVENTATAAHDIYTGATLTAASHTFSVYAKPNGRAWVNLFVFQSGGATNTVWFDVSSGTIGTVAAGTTATIVPAGNGWYRCSITFTALAAAASAYARLSTGNNVSTYTGDGTSGIYLWGAQLEAGAFPTSYIPTAASQVTRAADNAVITGANFSRWYNQSEGTFVVEADSAVPTLPSVFRSVGATDGSASNAIAMFVYNGRWGASSNVGGVIQADLLVNGSHVSNVPAKSAFAYKVNDIAFSANGSVALTDTAALIPTVDRLTIGALNAATGGFLYGHIRRIRYYPTRLSNSQLQALTA